MKSDKRVVSITSVGGLGGGYSQLGDQTCIVYGWHACNVAGFNPTGVERSRHGQCSTPNEGCGTHRKTKVTLVDVVVVVITIILCMHTYITSDHKWIIHAIICTGDDYEPPVYGVLFGYEREESSLSQFRTANQMIKKKPHPFFSSNCEWIIIVWGKKHILPTEASRKSFSGNK